VVDGVTSEEFPSANPKMQEFKSVGSAQRFFSVCSSP